MKETSHPSDTYRDLKGKKQDLCIKPVEIQRCLPCASP